MQTKSKYVKKRACLMRGSQVLIYHRRAQNKKIYFCDGKEEKENAKKEEKKGLIEIFMHLAEKAIVRTQK